MITITCDGNSEAGRTLINVARALKRSSKHTVIHIYNEEDNMTDEELDAVLEALPFQRIPGLPYTHEERIESLRQAEENIAAGKVYSHEEVMDEMRERIQTWK